MFIDLIFPLSSLFCCFFYTFWLLLCPAGINKVFILSFCTPTVPALHSTRTSPSLLSLNTFNQISRPPYFSTYLLFFSFKPCHDFLSCLFFMFFSSNSIHIIFVFFFAVFLPSSLGSLHFSSPLRINVSFLLLVSLNFFLSHFLSPSFFSCLFLQLLHPVPNFILSPLDPVSVRFPTSFTLSFLISPRGQGRSAVAA